MVTRAASLLSAGPLMWVLALSTAVGIAAGVYRIPVQAPDSLEVIERVDALPSMSAVFVDSLHVSTTMFRPLRYVQAKALLELADLRGVGDTRAFRGFHAAASVLLVLLFTAALRCRTWTDLAAGLLALTVLTGLHTSAPMFREAYPVNHFLLVAIYGLIMLQLARSRGGWMVDAAAAVCGALALLTLESGALVLVVAAVAYATGARGISRRGLAALALVLVAYAGIRVGYLHIGSAEVGERPVGFGLGVLDAEAIRARFAQPPLALYAYSAASSALTVLFSEPIGGTWTALRAWLEGSLHASTVIALGTSSLTTLLCAWYAASRDPQGRRRVTHTVPAVAAGVVAASAAMSFAYAKTDIMSTAGVFYALATYHAARHLFNRAPSWAFATRQVIVVAMVLTSGGWAVRAMGLQYHLERFAFLTRNDWVHDDRFSLEAHTTTAIESSLRRQALRGARTNPYLMSPAAEDLWGAE